MTDKICIRCDGFGGAAPSPKQPCEDCNGTGRIGDKSQSQNNYIVIDVVSGDYAETHMLHVVSPEDTADTRELVASRMYVLGLTGKTYITESPVRAHKIWPAGEGRENGYSDDNLRAMAKAARKREREALMTGLIAAYMLHKKGLDSVKDEIGDKMNLAKKKLLPLLAESGGSFVSNAGAAKSIESSKSRGYKLVEVDDARDSLRVVIEKVDETLTRIDGSGGRLEMDLGDIYDRLAAIQSALGKARWTKPRAAHVRIAAPKKSKATE